MFLRAGQMAQLDKLRTDHMNGAAIAIQRHVRGFLVRKWFAAWKANIILLQAAWRAYFARMEYKRMRELRAAITIQVLQGFGEGQGRALLAANADRGLCRVEASREVDAGRAPTLGMWV